MQPKTNRILGKWKTNKQKQYKKVSCLHKTVKNKRKNKTFICCYIYTYIYINSGTEN